MKWVSFYLLFIIAFFAIYPAFAADKNLASEAAVGSVEDCHETAMSQAAMDECWGRDTKKAEAEMDKELADIRVRIADKPEKLKKLAEAQKAWKVYMAAQLDFLYFDHGGSAAPMCTDALGTELIQERTKQLKIWVSDSVDNTCGGGLY